MKTKKTKPRRVLPTIASLRGCPLPSDGLTYTGAAFDAEKRMAAGQTQRQCTLCALWRWPDRLEACERLRSDEPEQKALTDGKG